MSSEEMEKDVHLEASSEARRWRAFSESEPLWLVVSESVELVAIGLANWSFFFWVSDEREKREKES